MDALTRIPSSEFNEDVFKKMRAMLMSVGNAEITIAVSNKSESLDRNESKEEYWNRINNSIADI